MSGPGGLGPEQESGVRDLRVAQRDPAVADGTGHASAAPSSAGNDPVSGTGTAASSTAARVDPLADRSTVSAGFATGGAVDPAQLRHELGLDDPPSAGDLIRLAKRFASVRAREKVVDKVLVHNTMGTLRAKRFR